eukprot:CAMPEP_0181504076 /NCGR_PEP_ID=MMETSP1110-20121109/57298_1 /TAXON_ID=174948 /ORGANISM="Symbiodinium sp., Strain CCMP421" /LENGTH=148 /DNA_ID=CAMNT_0023632903 /DNA_START=341 /DNA_END=785 /DNA_ORIENTATION=-
MLVCNLGLPLVAAVAAMTATKSSGKFSGERRTKFQLRADCLNQQGRVHKAGDSHPATTQWGIAHKASQLAFSTSISERTITSCLDFKVQPVRHTGSTALANGPIRRKHITYHGGGEATLKIAWQGDGLGMDTHSSIRLLKATPALQAL